MNELEDIRKQIEQKKAELKELRARRDKLEQKTYEAETGELRGGDSHFVLISEMKPLVARWIELYNYQHGKGGSRTLAERSRVHTRTIRTIKNGSSNGRKFITLETAGRLFRGMSMEYKLQEIQIFTTQNILGKRTVVPEPPYSKFEEE